jgi:hypothetical protein
MNCKSKLFHWVFESFPTDASSNAQPMNPNANNTYASGNNLPYAGADFTGGQATPLKNDIAEEKLKTPFKGITTFSELKEKTDTILIEMNACVKECSSKDATASSYKDLIKLIQEPEVLAILEHIRQETENVQQELRNYN